MRQSPEELAKVVARELAVHPKSREEHPQRRWRPVLAFRVVVSAVVVLAFLVPAIEGADWIERALAERNESVMSLATSTTSPNEVLPVVVDAPEPEGRIVSEPVLSSVPGLRSIAPDGAPTSGDETPVSTVTTVPSSGATSSPMTPTTTSTSVAPSTTSTTTAPTTTTTEPTTTTTCSGNSGGNGQGNNCKSA